MSPKLPFEFSPNGAPSGAVRPCANCSLQQRTLVAFPTVLTELNELFGSGQKPCGLEKIGLDSRTVRNLPPVFQTGPAV